MAKLPDAFWKQPYALILRIALSRTRNRAQAEDVAQEAFTQAFAELPNPADVQSFVRLAASKMRRHLSNERRNERKRQDPSWIEAAARASTGPRRTPEDVAAVRERKARALALLQERLDQDSLERRIVGRILMGDETPAQWAEALGEDIETIRKARKRLARHVEAIAAAEGPLDDAPGWDTSEREEDEEVGVES